jgi:hypothetical protein
MNASAAKQMDRNRRRMIAAHLWCVTIEWARRVNPGLPAAGGHVIAPVIAGLDPAIHLFEKVFVKMDGCAGQARA